jgi:hypothetical protein
MFYGVIRNCTLLILCFVPFSGGDADLKLRGGLRGTEKSSSSVLKISIGFQMFILFTAVILPSNIQTLFVVWIRKSSLNEWTIAWMCIKLALWLCYGTHLQILQENAKYIRELQIFWNNFLSPCLQNNTFVCFLRKSVNLIYVLWLPCTWTFYLKNDCWLMKGTLSLHKNISQIQRI